MSSPHGWELKPIIRSSFSAFHCCCSLSGVWRALYLRARQSPLISSLRYGPNDSSSDFIGDLFVVEDGDGAVTTNCRKHCAKLCEFWVDRIASSPRAAVSYSRLTEAGFDSSRLGLGASSTPHGSRNLWFLRIFGDVDSAVARQPGEIVIQQPLRRSNE